MCCGVSLPTAIIEPSAGRAEAGGAPLRAVAMWLLGCCAMIFAMVVIGGITRLTLSGLSITEWQPVTGILPPLSGAAWTAEFEKYQQIPQYRLVNHGMSLAEFQTIYWWEYVHRLWGRLIGFAYAVPLIYFLARGRIPRRLTWPLIGIFALGAAQGALGWYMVESGLADRVEVSQYRLVAHLALALAIYSAILWIALGIVRGTRSPLPNHPPQVGEGRVGSAWRRGAEATLALVALTIATGGFVAGTRAGLTYNTFPLMDGGLVPAGYDQLHSFYMNWFENIAAVQFDHRVLAMASFAVVLSVWVAGLRSRLPNPA